MTNAEDSYVQWWIERNGMSPSEHAMGRIPYVSGYEAAEKDMKLKFTRMIESACVRDVSLQRII